MQKVSSTRMELLARKRQIVLAERGRELLEQKRTALIKVFLQVADAVMESSEALQQAAATARRALARAEAMAGTETVRSAAIAARTEFPIRVETASVMGVKVPLIEKRRASRSMVGRGYSLPTTSITIDEAASAFEAEVDAVIQLAESELRLRRLADEIQRTSRRLNALNHLLIPRLEAECRHIEMTLDERERSDLFRLKLVKRILEYKQKEMPANEGETHSNVESER
jgi:V/A-type H+-transporting ATPase subunit D